MDIHYFVDCSSRSVLGLGFTGPTGQLLTVPPNAFAFFVIIFNSWSSDRFRERPRHIIAGLLFTGTGYLLLAVTTNLGARYTGLMLAVRGVCPSGVCD